jgi:hypothetical protein
VETIPEKRTIMTPKYTSDIFRFLEEGEEVLNGDQFLGYNGKDEPVLSTNAGGLVSNWEFRNRCYRRKVASFKKITTADDAEYAASVLKRIANTLSIVQVCDISREIPLAISNIRSVAAMLENAKTLSE